MIIALRNYIKKCFFLFLISSIIFLTSFFQLCAEDINWIQVANTQNKIQSIDVNSIKYNSSGFLSVLTKYSEIDPEDQTIINTKSYLMAIDCENRLFSELPVNGEVNEVKTWTKPINDKLTKTTIINSCLY